MKRHLIDTGPIVAFLNRRDQHHRWALQVLGAVAPPVYTCEAVLSEACFLLRRLPGGQDAVLELMDRGLVRVAFDLESELARVRSLMASYSDVPMSLADACLVRMTELYDDSVVVTVDSDFQRYRRLGRRVIARLTP